jgi:hypothetical protein
MWYITSDMRGTGNHNGSSVGGMGHVFTDILTNYIISRIYNIEHIHTPIRTMAFDARRKNPVNGNTHPNWEQLFNFGKGEKSISNLPKCKMNYFKLKPRFSYVEKEELDQYFSKFNRDENIIFSLCYNNRIFLWQFYYWCTHNIVSYNLWHEVRNNFIDKIIYKPKIQPGHIVIHIRRGDDKFKTEPIDFAYNALKQIMSLGFPITKVTVQSYGDDESQKEITNKYHDITYDFQYNTDTIQTFKTELDAHVLITASSMSKLAGYYSDAIKMYMPYKAYVRGFPDHMQEDYDPRWIKTTPEGSFNSDDFTKQWQELDQTLIKN